MKIASWNVNSLNVRLPHLLDWLRQAQPDVVALQETKLEDAKFPDGPLAEAGYRSVFCGQKTYNGVAILSRTPATDVQYGVPGLEDEQKRVIAATVDGVRIVDLYVVNGQSVGSEKYDYKLRWIRAVHDWLERLAVGRWHPALEAAEVLVLPIGLEIWQVRRLKTAQDDAAGVTWKQVGRGHRFAVSLQNEAIRPGAPRTRQGRYPARLQQPRRSQYCRVRRQSRRQPQRRPQRQHRRTSTWFYVPDRTWNLLATVERTGLAACGEAGVPRCVHTPCR